MKKRRNRCLNFFKGIACFGVICAHMNLQGLIGRGLLNLISWTVPFFFMISGFYSYYEKEEEFFKKNKIKINNILKVTIISLAFYFIVTFCNEFLKNDLNQLLEEIFQSRMIFDVLVLNDFTAINAGHLWFLVSLVYCYLALRWIVKYKKQKFMYWSIPILLIIRMILYPIAIEGDSWHYLQNVFVGGFPGFFAGYYFATHQNQVDKITNKLNNTQLRCIIIIGILISFIGTFIKLPIHIFEIGTIAAYHTIFILAKKNPNMYISKTFETIGVKYSGFIYIMHVLFVLITRLLFNKLNLNHIFGAIYIRTILVMILTLSAAIIFRNILSKLSPKKKFG